MDSKAKLRSICKEKRKHIENKIEKEKTIAKKILNHEKVKKTNNILIYVSMDIEVATIELIKELFKLNKNIYVPKVIGKNIKFYKIDSLNELKISKLGILEPITNIEYTNNNDSVCIIPGLMFSKNNNRLGYGGGYYDRFLKNCNTYKIGICFKEFLVDNLEAEKHDIKMNEVITD